MNLVSDRNRNSSLSMKIMLGHVVILWITLFFSYANANANASAAPQSIRLRFFDVGEGDATLITTSVGEHVLIDTGNLITGVELVDKLTRRGIKKLEYLVITHPHPDHIGGVFSLLHRIPVKHVYDNGEDLTSVGSKEDIYRWYSDLVRMKPEYRAISAGELIPCGAATLQVISPGRQKMSSDWNTNSLVMKLTLGKFSVLLMGDGNFGTEEQLLHEGHIDASVLKAGHHGARDTGSDAFVKQVHPSAVLISTNRGNIRGYPAHETVENYRKTGAVVAFTYEGDIDLIGREDGSYSLTQGSHVLRSSEDSAL